MLSILSGLKLFFKKLGSGSVFLLEVENAKVHHVKGEKYIKFVQDCEDIVKEHGITSGIIYAVKDADGKIRVKTSSEISRDSAQRIRNAWSFYS